MTGYELCPPVPICSYHILVITGNIRTYRYGYMTSRDETCHMWTLCYSVWTVSVPHYIYVIHEHHGDSIICSTANISIKSKFHITDLLWGESNGDQRTPLVKDQLCRDYFHVMMSLVNWIIAWPSGHAYQDKRRQHRVLSHCSPLSAHTNFRHTNFSTLTAIISNELMWNLIHSSLYPDQVSCCSSW